MRHHFLDLNPCWFWAGRGTFSHCDKDLKILAFRLSSVKQNWCLKTTRWCGMRALSARSSRLRLALLGLNHNPPATPRNPADVQLTYPILEEHPPYHESDPMDKLRETTLPPFLSLRIAIRRGLIHFRILLPPLKFSYRCNVRTSPPPSPNFPQIQTYLG